MYGLVNRAIQDLAVHLGGGQAWAEIKSRAGVDVESLVSMDVYPDDVTYRLVEAASDVFRLPAEEVLRAFGRHWILYTGRKGYGAVFETMGRTLPEFLLNLDAMHARLSLSMPELRPPSFVCQQEGEEQIRLQYWSEREGLAPMVVGLLEGLGDLFELEVTVVHDVSRLAGHDHDEFVVHYLPRRAVAGGGGIGRVTQG
ncbi:MAG: heme NO-binding domain-containing protein [Actinomycetes bacterium]